MLVKEDIVKKIDKQIMFLREYFIELKANESVKQISIKVMRQYGLLPNDALIASTCKYYGIEKIITFEGDFKTIPSAGSHTMRILSDTISQAIIL